MLDVNEYIIKVKQLLKYRLEESTSVEWSIFADYKGWDLKFQCYTDALTGKRCRGIQTETYDTAQLDFNKPDILADRAFTTIMYFWNNHSKTQP